MQLVTNDSYIAVSPYKNTDYILQGGKFYEFVNKDIHLKTRGKMSSHCSSLSLYIFLIPEEVKSIVLIQIKLLLDFQ